VNAAGLWLLDHEGLKRLDQPAAGVSPGPQDEGLAAIWSTDAKEVIFTRLPGRSWRQPLDRPDLGRPLPGASGFATDWSRDGRYLLLQRPGQSPTVDIEIHDLTSGETRPWLATAFNEAQGRMSPDSRWVAYASDSSGRMEVYVRNLARPESPTPVSTNGGTYPSWRSDGHELYFLGPNDELMSAEVSDDGGTLRIGAPTQLFRIALNDIVRDFVSPYEPAPDGQRFLLNVPDSPTPLLSWPTSDRPSRLVLGIGQYNAGLSSCW
jgi:hypothetical protein